MSRLSYYGRNLVERNWLVPLALGLYFLCGVLLVAQRPGLHYDEALLVEGAVQMRHSTTEIALPHAPNTWVCLFQRCLPLMGEGPYIGSVKDYLALPMFAVLGTTPEAVRLTSMLLAMIGIWGMAKLVKQEAGRRVGESVAFLLALNPAYVNMTVFDNGVVAPMMAGLGLLCAALAAYRKSPSFLAAFAFGVAAGFAVWTRANFVWTLAAGGLAAGVVFGRRVLIPTSHVWAIVCGGIAGGFPFLLYQALSRAGTLRAMRSYATQEPLLPQLPVRLFWLAETLFSDGEHRVMWGAVQLPGWQLWWFPLVLAAGGVICFISRSTQNGEPWRVPRFVALTLLILTGFPFSSHLEVAGHHLIAVLPFAIAVVVLACTIVQQRRRWGWVASAGLAFVYFALAGYWEARSIQGLRNTGGTGVWSDGAMELARVLEREYPNREINLLDWGLQSNLFVIMDGRLNSKQLFAGASAEHSGQGRPWPEELRDGGVFLLTGIQHRAFAAPAEGFLRALTTGRPIMRLHTIAERSGSTYAEIIEIQPNSLQSGSTGPPREFKHTISMSDPDVETRLKGFHEVQPDGWRWTEPDFSVLLDAPPLNSLAVLHLKLFVPAPSIEKLGPMTIRATLGNHTLEPETYGESGQYTFIREVPANWIMPGLNRLEFKVDKHLGPSQEDSRELGIVVKGISLRQ
jgi:hypothetical protein